MTLTNRQLLESIDTALKIATLEDSNFLYTYRVNEEIIDKIPLYADSSKKSDINTIYNSSFSKLLIYQCHKAHDYPRHYHNYKKIFYILEGKVEIEVDNKINILNVGESLIIDSYQLHKFKALEDAKVLLLMVLT